MELTSGIPLSFWIILDILIQDCDYHCVLNSRHYALYLLSNETELLPMSTTTYENSLMRTAAILLPFLLSAVLLSGCSTRHVADQYFGSTEQRLVSHSLNTLIGDLPDSALVVLKNKSVLLKSFFIKDTPLSRYAHERLSMELAERVNATVVDDVNNVDFEMKVFFTSIGTDRDTAGFSLPLFFMPADNARAEIPLIAIDMYHGISEMYFYITDNATGEVTKSTLFNATTKTDKIATPIISFPINHLK